MARAALLALLALAAPPVQANPLFRMSLDGAVTAAMASSHVLKAAEHDYQAARQRLWGAGSFLLPQVSLDGNYRYVTEVPEMKLDPRGAPIKFGDNESYSVGPTAAWTVWDWGASYQAWRSAGAAAGSKCDEVEAVRKQVKLGATVTYVQAQMCLEQLRLVTDAMLLARSQHKDVSAGLAAGAASRIDSLQAHQEVLARERQFAAARADLANALQDLFALTATGTGLDTSAPDYYAHSLGLRTDELPNLLVDFDPLDSTIDRLTRDSWRHPTERNPRVRALSRLAESSDRAAAAVLTTHLPRVQVTARYSLDYPNGPVLDEIHQKTIGVAVSVPLVSWGRVFRDEWERREQARAVGERRDLALAEANRDYIKARDRMNQLRKQREIARQASAETGELARLVYESYQSGAVRFTEVQAANLRALEARVQEARIKAELLVQLAILESLSEEETKCR